MGLTLEEALAQLLGNATGFDLEGRDATLTAATLALVRQPSWHPHIGKTASWPQLLWWLLTDALNRAVRDRTSYNSPLVRSELRRQPSSWQDLAQVLTRSAARMLMRRLDSVSRL